MTKEIEKPKGESDRRGLNQVDSEERRNFERRRAERRGPQRWDPRAEERKRRGDSERRRRGYH